MVKALALASFAAIALGFLWSVDAVAHVEAYDETRRVDPWAERGSFRFAPLAADGAEQPAGEPGYFTSEAPRVRVAFTWSLDDPATERVTALGSLRLLVERAAAPGKPATSQSFDLAGGTLTGGPSDALTLEGEIDLPAVEASLGREREGASWSLAAQVKFATAPHGAHAAEASEFVAPLAYTPPLYVLPSEAEATLVKDHARTEVVHHERQGGLAALGNEPAGVALLFAGLAGLTYALPLLSRDPEAAA
jgi:hypothetical protein